MKINIFRLLPGLLLLVVGCVEDPVPPYGGDDPLSPYQREVVEYFTEVALGFEFGSASKITRKWNRDIRVFVGGEQKTELMNELDDIISELNELITDNVNISVTTDTTNSNFYIFLGKGETYGNIFPSQADLVQSNWGLFNVNWDSDQHIDEARMYVDIYRPGADGQKHLLREELTQALGLAKDSPKYQNSIFQSSWTTVIEYMEIDRDLIRLLYHPQMIVGLNKTQTEEQLEEILLAEN